MTDRRFTVVGAGTSRGPLSQALADPDTDPHAFVEAAMEVANLVVAAARAAWDGSGLGPAEAEGAECWMGTLYGTTHVSEYYAAALHGSRPLLNPRAFSFSCLNSVSSAVSSALGLTGAGITVVGRNAGSDALAHACRALALGRTRHAVCGAFDWPSPFASAVLSRGGLSVSASEGAAAVLIVTAQGMAAAASASPITIRADSAAQDHHVDGGIPTSSVSPAVAPLLRIADMVARRDGQEAFRPTAPVRAS